MTIISTEMISKQQYTHLHLRKLVSKMYSFVHKSTTTRAKF